MYKNLFSLFFALSLTITTTGQQVGLFSIEIPFQGSQREMCYSVPTDYNSSSSYPLVIVLHGCGQQASEIRDDFAFLSDSLNAIVVAPQGPDFNGGFFLQEQNEMMIWYAYDSTSVVYNIDQDRLYLMGFSCNGFSTLDVGTNIGVNLFKGIIPISATVSEVNMQYINFNYESPVCICVGGADAMAVEANTSIHDQFLENDADVLYLETPLLGHDYFFDGYENKTMTCFDYIDNVGNPLNMNKPEISNIGLELYPNPAYSEISIKTNELNKAGTRIRIFNVKSDCVYEGSLNSSPFEVEFLLPGLYFVQIIDSNSIKTGKFIKK